DASGATICTISTLSNLFFPIIPLFSLPYDPSSERYLFDFSFSLIFISYSSSIYSPTVFFIQISYF
ncbi:hypothetical protein NX871_32235, partial [Burkholderia thailandensis]|uniref:hypothetical protein n=1 Tax=Burkholderia thailandensis TaxID=57975 RepID=UPI00217E78F8